MKKIPLEKNDDAKLDLFMWIREYLMSKIYVISCDDSFNKKKDYYYRKLESALNINESKDIVAEIQRNGMYNLSSYSGHVFKYYDYVASKKKLYSIKELDNNFINTYIQLNPYFYKTSTLTSHYNQIKSLYKYIDSNFWDEKNQFSGFKIGYTVSGKKCQSPIIKENDSEPLYLEPEKFTHLLTMLERYPFRIDNRNQPILMIKLLAFSGLRIKELSEIKRENISFIENSTDELPEKTKYMRIKVIGKGNKERVVYIKASLVADNYEAIINDLELRCDYLFCTKNNTKYAVRTIYDFLKRIYKFSGVYDKYSAHMLHRTYASILVLKNVPIEQISKLLGHSNEELTEIYIHISSRSLQDVVPLLEIL